MGKSNGKRGPGAPSRGQEIITPEVLQQIASLHLRNVTMAKIGEKFGVSAQTIHHHIETKLRPFWREAMIVDAQEELAKVAQLEAAAWEHYEKEGDHSVLQNVRWALEYRAKLAGLFIERRELTVKGEIRIAGRSPEEFDAETVDMILDDMGKRHAFQAALKARLN